MHTRRKDDRVSLPEWSLFFLLSIPFMAIVGCGGSSGPTIVDSESEQLTFIQEKGGTAELNEEGHIIKVDLHETEIDDSSLTKLKGLSQLKHLDLRGTSVTDAALDHLKDFDSLKFLDISVTEVTEDAADKFRKEMPNVDVSGPQV